MWMMSLALAVALPFGPQLRAADSVKVAPREAALVLARVLNSDAVIVGTATDTELATLSRFYMSATGQKLIAAMMASIKPTAMLAEAKASPDFQIGVNSVQKDIRAAVPDALKQMDTSDQMTLMMLAGTGLLERLQAMAPQTQAIALEWNTQEAPWEEAAMDKALSQVMKRFGVGEDE